MRLNIPFFALTAAIGTVSVWAQTAPPVELYKSPSCECCSRWVDYLQKNGFKVEAHVVDDVPAVRRKLGMPDALASCHTARIGNYVVEGHVPAQDIQRLLKDKPQALGLAIPSMPPGVPGMDIPGSPPYETLLVRADGGTRVFARH